MTPETTFDIELGDADETRAFGLALASALRGGDLIILTGDLGAGKTTLTQGIGAGLGIRGQVASPTFIIAREHPSLANGPALVHVDAYRLGSLDEVDALDLDSSLDEAVTVVEWGSGLVERLAQDRLEITLRRPRGQVDAALLTQEEVGAASTGSVAASADDEYLDHAEVGIRRATVTAFGERWAGVDLAAITTPTAKDLA